MGLSRLIARFEDGRERVWHLRDFKAVNRTATERRKEERKQNTMTTSTQV